MPEPQDVQVTTPQYDPRYEAGDTFIGAVPITRTKVILIYRRLHSCRKWVRIRVWNLHREKLLWYPTRRYFVVPFTAVRALSEVMHYAMDGQPGTKPDWLKAHGCGIDEQLWALRDKGVSDDVIEARQRDIEGKGHYDSFLPLLLEDELVGTGDDE